MLSEEESQRILTDQIQQGVGWKYIYETLTKALFAKQNFCNVVYVGVDKISDFDDRKIQAITHILRFYRTSIKLFYRCS